MVDRACRLSSTTEAFEHEYDKLCVMFTTLCYPHHLIESTIWKFNQIEPRDTPCETDRTVYVKLPFKSQQSAERVRREMVPLKKNWRQTPTRIH